MSAFGSENSAGNAEFVGPSLSCYAFAVIDAAPHVLWALGTVPFVRANEQELPRKVQQIKSAKLLGKSVLKQLIIIIIFIYIALLRGMT